MPDSWDYSQKRQRRTDIGSDMPLVTYLLCGLCGLMTLAYHTSGQMPGTLWYQIGHFGIPSPEDIWNGRYWMLLTPFFYHGDLLHIAFNVIWLWQLGTVLETTLPAYTYALFLVASAAIGSAIEMLVSGNTGIGASGVVYAMFGLLWAGKGQYLAWGRVATKQNFQYFVLWGILCIITTYTNIMPIANGAHAGGFLFGLSIGWLFFAPRRRPLWAIPLVVLCILSALALIWIPWSSEWDFWKGNQEFNHKQYRSAITWYQASLERGGGAEPNWQNMSMAWHQVSLQEAEHNNSLGAQEAEAQEQKALEKANAEAALKTKQPENGADSNP